MKLYLTWEYDDLIKVTLEKEICMAKQQTGWAGWVYFAATLMLINGVFELFRGIFALTNGDFFVASGNQIVLFNTTSWGWIQVGMGLVVLTGAISLFSGHFWGRFVGAIATILATITTLVWLPAYPIWGVVALVLDLVVLWAIIAHGNEA